jgi:excisionase family DNA binding protein
MLTTKQAAAILGFKSHRPVVALIRRGVLRAEKIGRDWIIEAAEVERYRVERRPAHRPKKDG